MEYDACGYWCKESSLTSWPAWRVEVAFETTEYIITKIYFLLSDLYRFSPHGGSLTVERGVGV